jgi:hypothetical protein
MEQGQTTFIAASLFVGPAGICASFTHANCVATLNPAAEANRPAAIAVIEASNAEGLDTEPQPALTRFTAAATRRSQSTERRANASHTYEAKTREQAIGSRHRHSPPDSKAD